MSDLASDTIDPAGDGPTPWADVFLAECRALDPAFPEPPVPSSDGPAREAAINRDALARGHAALCLSGGGIRSASFAVGVLQGFARHGLFQRFDYLSTVSGGGFAGAWLTAWLHRATEHTDKDDGRAAHEAF